MLVLDLRRVFGGFGFEQEGPCLTLPRAKQVLAAKGFDASTGECYSAGRLLVPLRQLEHWLSP